MATVDIKSALEIEPYNQIFIDLYNQMIKKLSSE